VLVVLEMLITSTPVERRKLLVGKRTWVEGGGDGREGGGGPRAHGGRNCVRRRLLGICVLGSHLFLLLSLCRGCGYLLCKVRPEEGNMGERRGKMMSDEMMPSFSKSSPLPPF
jgi:hypothetical protein